MANLTLRQTKDSPLTIDEMDSNFEYFTGSYTNTGIITAQGFSGSFTGSLQGTAQTASYVQNVISSSFATTASYFNGGTFLNPTTQSLALTISSGYNASLTGPIYNSSSIIIEIGARLVIL